jgi:GDP-L-fucose synthase
MLKNSKIYVAGHRGLVGSAITRELVDNGYSDLVFTPHDEYDLTDQKAVAKFFKSEKPEYVFLAAAKVGGIVANNKYRAQFLYENLMIQNNIIHNSYLNGVKKLLFLGSSCIYPRECPQPIKEEYLLTDVLEYTNEPYAIAKIAGIKMCESYNIQYGTNFISVMPTNLYGPNDNYNLETSHVLPALIRKMYLGKCLENNNWEAIRTDLDKRPVEGIDGKSEKSDILSILKRYGISFIPGMQNPELVTISLWGTGSPYREFLHVDDLAEACVFLMNTIDFKDLVNYSGQKQGEIRNTHINIGTGKDLTIKELAGKIKSIVRFQGNLEWDETKPDGTYRKLLDVSKINNLGWKEKTSLESGIEMVYTAFTE